MDWDKTFVLRPNKKPFSFRGGGKLQPRSKSKNIRGNWFYVDDYNMIQAILPKLVEDGFKSIIIDDSTHLMVDEFMKATTEKGYEKFNRLANNYYNLIKKSEALPDDTIVYIVNHVEEDANGNVQIKTIGKLLSEKINIPSYLSISLISERTKDGYKFRTQTSGRDFAKSPEGMFESEYIDNDLKIVDDAIREYFGI